MHPPGTSTTTAGARLRAALEAERPLQIVGAVNAYTAMMAAASGFRALYLSGSGVATASYGWPDLGITSLPDVLEDVRRVSAATDRPLLVDADTGWGNAFSVTRTVKEMTRAGAAGIHLEDQATAKRCGHRPNKEIVSADEMCDRLKAACDGRTDPDFVLMARTDAAASEGVDAAIGRACRYRDAGADMIFAEAIGMMEDYRRFVDAVGVPVLANITEFGQTPMFTVEELGRVGVRLVLYPLSAFRAMNAAALEVYRTIRKYGTQAAVLPKMQTRAELYEFLNYHAYEEQLDALPSYDGLSQ